MMKHASVLGFLCALGLLSTDPARAQTIKGKLIDEVTGEAVASGAVVLTGLDGALRTVTRSDADGRFTLQSLPGDTVRVRVERGGYETLESRPWVIARDGLLQMTLRLHPAPVTLDTLTITGAWRSRNRTRYERRRRSEVTGQFADGSKLARVRVPRTSLRLQMLFPRILGSPDGVVRVRRRGVDIDGSASCQPRLVIDGMRYPGDLSLDALVSGPEIRAVEFYPDALFAPGDLAFGYDRMIVGGKETLSKPCAVIVIWTYSGLGEPGS